MLVRLAKAIMRYEDVNNEQRWHNEKMAKALPHLNKIISFHTVN